MIESGELYRATPLHAASVRDDDALTLVILSERVRERVEGSPDGARDDPTLCGRSRPDRSPDPVEILRLGLKPSLRMTRGDVSLEEGRLSK